VHIRKVQQLHYILQVDKCDKELLAQSLEAIESVLVGCHQHVDGLVGILKLKQLVRVDELE